MRRRTLARRRIGEVVELGRSIGGERRVGLGRELFLFLGFVEISPRRSVRFFERRGEEGRRGKRRKRKKGGEKRGEGERLKENEGEGRAGSLFGS